MLATDKIIVNAADVVSETIDGEVVIVNLRKGDQPHYLLGQIYTKTKEPEKAIAEYKLVVEKKYHSGAYYNLIEILIDLNRLEEARQFVDRAIKINPDLSQNYYQLALILRKQQQWQQMIAALFHKIELDPVHEYSY